MFILVSNRLKHLGGFFLDKYIKTVLSSHLSSCQYTLLVYIIFSICNVVSSIELEKRIGNIYLCFSNYNKKRNIKFSSHTTYSSRGIRNLI